MENSHYIGMLKTNERDQSLYGPETINAMGEKQCNGIVLLFHLQYQSIQSYEGT